VVSKSGIREGYLYKNILTAKKETAKTISPIEAKNELNYAAS
jgi:exopolyphosphatase/guanosine-5'-triphosphate,3'-diphosphate pyrophosphatase